MVRSIQKGFPSLPNVTTESNESAKTKWHLNWELTQELQVSCCVLSLERRGMSMQVSSFFISDESQIWPRQIPWWKYLCSSKFIRSEHHDVGFTILPNPLPSSLLSMPGSFINASAEWINILYVLTIRIVSIPFGWCQASSDWQKR